MCLCICYMCISLSVFVCMSLYELCVCLGCYMYMHECCVCVCMCIKCVLCGHGGIHIYMQLCSLMNVCACGAQKSMSGVFFNHVSFWEYLWAQSSPMWLDRLESKPLKSTHLPLPTPSLGLSCLWPWSALYMSTGGANMGPYPCTLYTWFMSFLFSNIAES